MRGHRRVLLAAILLVAAVGLGTSALRQGDDSAEALDAKVVVPAETTTTTTTTPPHSFTGAMASGAEVGLYDAPGAAAPFRALPNPTLEDVPLAFLVLDKRADGWMHVRYNQRPNGATAWIRGNEVTTYEVPNRLVVALGARQLTVYAGSSDRVLFQAPVAIGTPSTPTPLGEFYVDIVVQLTNTTGPYGPYQLSVGAFSETLTSFGGGQAQIAIHGTNRPDLIGGDVSNGCIRMNNDDILALVPLAPTGTPVSIVA